MVIAALVIGALNSVLLFLVLAFAIGAFRALLNEKQAHRETLKVTAAYIARTAPTHGVAVPASILRAAQGFPRA